MKPIRFLLDENLPRRLKNQLMFHEPTMDVLLVGEEHAPPLGTPDPEILDWLQDNHYLLVSRNRSTMPVHLKDHIAKNGHIPGILVVRKDVVMGRLIEDLLLIWSASHPEEYRNQIIYLPFE